mmetsp:Transcript_95799/g.254400  ORF Transcript_95799/g.254400 Transcript_95799/m.254400 type:complete len:84 (-) Transcript_95799:172-423(-)
MDGVSPGDVEKTAALLHMQQAVQGQKVTMKILGHCFTRCIDTPPEGLSAQDQQCLWNCTQRMFDSEQFLIRRLMAAQKQKGGM